jgi:hypothetical protein
VTTFVSKSARALAIASTPQHANVWEPGFLRPRQPGLYERQSLLGVVIDVFDGSEWRRTSKTHNVERGHSGFTAGVVCANQDLPWRKPR